MQDHMLLLSLYKESIFLHFIFQIGFQSEFFVIIHLD